MDDADDIRRWEQEWRDSKARSSLQPEHTHGGASGRVSVVSCGREQGAYDMFACDTRQSNIHIFRMHARTQVPFQTEDLPAVQRPRMAGGSIAKEEVDRAFVHSMTKFSVEELLMKDAAVRDNYQALMDTDQRRPKSFLERVRVKAREDDGEGGSHLEAKDDSWLVHKYMEDLRASRQDNKEARARIAQLVDKVKDLEKEVKGQKDAAARIKRKAEDLEREKMDKERALGAQMHGNSLTASEQEARERAEEMVRECTLKDQVISLLQTENKSAKLVHDSKVRELEAKVAQVEGKLAVMSKVRDEERAAGESALRAAEAASQGLSKTIAQEKSAREREEAMRQAVEDNARIEKARYEHDMYDLSQALADRDTELAAANTALKSSGEKLARAQKESSLSRSELEVARREVALLTQSTETNVKAQDAMRREMQHEVDRLKDELQLAERDVTAKRNELALGEKEQQRAVHDLEVSRGELAAALEDKRAMQTELQRHLGDVAHLDSPKAMGGAQEGDAGERGKSERGEGEEGEELLRVGLDLKVAVHQLERQKEGLLVENRTLAAQVERMRRRA